MSTEEWFTLEDISEAANDETLYCISVSSPTKQFLIGDIATPTHNTEEGKAQDELKGEAQMIIGSIARLGRAAGTHLVVATQRPDATLLPGETKANLGCRINAGRTDASASNMILGNGEGTRVRSYPPGRLYIRIYSEGDHGQGLFAEPSWIDEYLESQGLNPDGTPISKGRQNTRKANIVDMESFGDGDLDSREGIDTQGAIDSYIAEGENDSTTTVSVTSDSTAVDDDSSLDDDFSFSIDDEAEDDDGTFSFEEVDEEEEVAPRAPTEPGDMSAPIVFGDKKEKDDRFARPEEDWDQSLDDLINENFD